MINKKKNSRNLIDAVWNCYTFNDTKRKTQNNFLINQVEMFCLLYELVDDDKKKLGEINIKPGTRGG